MADKKKTYGIKDLAKVLGVQEATARKNLRNANIKRTGRGYEWSKTELDATAKKLAMSAPAAPKKAAPAKKKGKKAA